MQIDIQLLHPEAKVPEYATPGASAFDLRAIIDPAQTLHPLRRYIHPGGSLIVRTGIAVAVPQGWGLFIYSRSGHGFKNDVSLSNCVGVIDSDYTGEIMVKLRNDSKEAFFVNHGDRIAQAVLQVAPRAQFIVREKLQETERGAGGMGSTGVA